MSDVLDTVAAPARSLLRRVDAVLDVAGAPADHGIWLLLRRCGAVPGDAFDGFCQLAPDRLAEVAGDLRRRSARYADQRAELDAAVRTTGWSGATADAFAGQWRAYAAHLGAPEAADSLAGRLAATASLVDDAAAWARAARRAMAHTLAECLGSLEAVRLRTTTESTHGVLPSPDVVAAAATIGVRVLDTALTHLEAADEIGERWAGQLGELPMRAVPVPAAGAGGPTEVLL